ncbi:MAG: tRNA 2-thiouridine(34) synthase MnmA [Actinomycetota bacterium]|nr:tRNA 2-thiouridine(34) synthase MnmA [Actinomycetota bacterium]
MRVLAAMSGGVDSSVAAALMKEEGHDVIGVTLKQWEGPQGEMPTAGCCTLADSEDARRVAAQLDVPYYVLNYVEEFRAQVVERFGADYLSGRTPNPCVECNRRVRFSRLLEQAAELECDVLVTGHYVRTRRGAEGYRLLRGLDAGKDQSYVLYMLGQDELARVRFPVGEMTKDETRRVAGRLGLRTADKRESQDICFVDGDYRDFLRRHFPQAAAPGRLMDVNRRTVGTHDGVARFTVGQRRGLGVAAGERRYVVDIEPATATVVLGRREDLLVRGCRVKAVSFVPGRPPSHSEVDVQMRYRSRPVRALLEAPSPAQPSPSRGRVTPTPALPRKRGREKMGREKSRRREADEWTVWFHEPQEAVAPGQAAVFFAGEEVLGGGTVAEAIR